MAEEPSSSTNNAHPIARLMVQHFLDEQLAPLRDSIVSLEALRAQDEASLRAALLKWSDQVAQFRAQVASLDACIQQQVSTSSEALREVERHERIINEL